jgi:hypothetical protein
MALGLASGVANGFMDALFRAVNYTAPTACWVKLHTADPGSAGTTAAASETTRKQFVSSSAAASGSVSNTTAMLWTAVAGTETYSHYSLWTASSGGTFLGSGALTVAKAVTAGDDFTFAVAAFTGAITLAA